MAEYIEREKAFYLIKEQKEKETGAYSKGRNKGLIIAGSIINNKEVLPTADVAEVKHGEWKWGKGLGGQYGIWCTNCGSGWVDSENAEWIAREHDYCGKCGAKMDGGKAE